MFTTVDKDISEFTSLLQKQWSESGIVCVSFAVGEVDGGTIMLN